MDNTEAYTNEDRETANRIFRRVILAGLFVFCFGCVSNSKSYRYINKALNSGFSAENVKQIIATRKAEFFGQSRLGNLCHYLFAGIGEEKAFREYELPRGYRHRKPDFC